jgi:hypothetical protein
VRLGDGEAHLSVRAARLAVSAFALATASAQTPERKDADTWHLGEGPAALLGMASATLLAVAAVALVCWCSPSLRRSCSLGGRECRRRMHRVCQRGCDDAQDCSDAYCCDCLSGCLRACRYASCLEPGTRADRKTPRRLIIDCHDENGGGAFLAGRAGYRYLPLDEDEDGAPVPSTGSCGSMGGTVNSSVNGGTLYLEAAQRLRRTGLVPSPRPVGNCALMASPSRRSLRFLSHSEKVPIATAGDVEAGARISGISGDISGARISGQKVELGAACRPVAGKHVSPDRSDRPNRATGRPPSCTPSLLYIGPAAAAAAAATSTPPPSVPPLPLHAPTASSVRLLPRPVRLPAPITAPFAVPIAAEDHPGGVPPTPTEGDDHCGVTPTPTMSSYLPSMFHATAPAPTCSSVPSRGISRGHGSPTCSSVPSPRSCDPHVDSVLTPRRLFLLQPRPRRQSTPATATATAAAAAAAATPVIPLPLPSGLHVETATPLLPLSPLSPPSPSPTPASAATRSGTPPPSSMAMMMTAREPERITSMAARLLDEARRKRAMSRLSSVGVLSAPTTTLGVLSAPTTTLGVLSTPSTTPGSGRLGVVLGSGRMGTVSADEQREAPRGTSRTPFRTRQEAQEEAQVPAQGEARGAETEQNTPEYAPDDPYRSFTGMVTAIGEKGPRRDTVASVAARQSLAATTAIRTASAIVEGVARDAVLELERKELAEIEASSRRLAEIEASSRRLGRSDAVLELELAEIEEERRAIEELEAREARAQDGGVGSAHHSAQDGGVDDVGSIGRRAEPGGGVFDEGGNPRSSVAISERRAEPGGGVFDEGGNPRSSVAISERRAEPGGGVFARDGEVEGLPTTASPTWVQEWPKALPATPATLTTLTDAQLGGSTEAQLPTMLGGSTEALMALEMVRDEGAH